MISESVRVGHDSEPRAGLHPAATAARPLSAGGLGRQGLPRCWVAAGPRHGRQQFLKQEFSWKNRETFALHSRRISLAAAAAGSQP